MQSKDQLITKNFKDLVGKNYKIILADPPWSYYGDPNKDQAAGKHYDLMSYEDLTKLEVRKIASKTSVIYMWTTGSHLQTAMNLMNAWGFFYRCVGHIWIKTTLAGKIIHGQGVRPSFIKQMSELMLIGSTHQRGRPLELMAENIPQVVLAARPGNVHSKKPDIFRKLITDTYGNVKRVELFCRTPEAGWDAWGNEV